VAAALERALLALLIGGTLFVVWHGIISTHPGEGFDSAAHIEYADVLAQGRLPREADTYEFASPPAFHWLTVRVENAAADARGSASPAQTYGWPVRLIWLALLVLGAALTAVGGRLLRGGGLALVLAAAVLAVVHAGAHAVATPWRSGQLVAAAATAVLLACTWLLGRVVWPRSRVLPLVAVAAVAALPIVPRLGVMFHPEMPFAALAALALVTFARAAASGWRVAWAWPLGALLGAAALTRQTAVALALGLALVALLALRRDAVRFFAATGAALLLLAGPWWVHQALRYGNPLQANVEREGYLREGGQPRSFYVSFPVVDLVLHPYRPAFQNELLPQFHADLWSDWFGGQHGYWGEPRPHATLFASTQSVLGFGATLLGLGGMATFGARALTALRRHGRAAAAGDVVLAAALVVAALTWLAFLVTLVRFPQEEGDPIKSSYMLFAAPLWVLALVAAGERLWRRGTWSRAALVVWCGLYLVSYTGYLATSW
jgi:hypothetical protein